MLKYDPGQKKSHIHPAKHDWRAGLEKLTNANRSVSKVNDRLYQVELTEIADWKSEFEYMLHLNLGKKTFEKGYWREFSCTYLYNTVPYQVIIS